VKIDEQGKHPRQKKKVVPKSAATATGQKLL